MIRLLSSADTELLAAARAVAGLPGDFPEVRCVNPHAHGDPAALAAEVADGARAIVVRLLGGRRAWPAGVDALRARCAADGIPLVLLGGEAEPDAELARLSTAPAGVVAQAAEYLRHGGVANTEQLLRFLADTCLLTGFGFTEPAELESFGAYLPGRGAVSLEEARATLRADRPTVGVVLYRAHVASQNTRFVDVLAAALEAEGVDPLLLWCQSLRPDADGRVPLLEGLEVDALVTTVLAGGGSTAADEGTWDAGALKALGVPVIQGCCATRSRAAWEASETGLSPLDCAMQIAIPEFDGRIVGPVFSFKEAVEGGELVGGTIQGYVADPERTARLAQLAAAHARLRGGLEGRRLALMLSSFPTKHARIGNAVGLDTPASAIGLLDALGVEHGFADGDALIHALIAAGGHDPDRLTDEQLAGAQARYPVARYRERFATLPEELRTSMEERWGPAPGDRYLDGDDLVIAGLGLGDVFVGIQPPRGYGEDQVAVYHDIGLAPAHHYLATYWWLEETWGAEAMVHLGKHGTLEWLPGKAVGLSAACAPDAALGSMPLVYPFVVNDPGEGVQAKRRAHAVVVDHLVPPMMRAETYDELAELEQLMDEHARCEVLDPAKLPMLASRIWTLIHDAELHHDLGVTERPEDDESFGALLEHLDGYLCEIKDIQVRDGLHVLGRAPEGEQLRGLVAAIARLGCGLRGHVARVLGLDEDDRVQQDRCEAVQQQLLSAAQARGWDPACGAAVAREVLDTGDGELVAALAWCCAEIVPRVLASSNETGAVLDALSGRHVEAGPSGSPTRGRLDVLPTGRNFYAVDPKAVPSELAYDVGSRLAEALLASGETVPETVGIVVWGTAAMRTHGDDVAEVLALLGVRPTWNRESRRITGLEVISLEELGRPRIDVTVRLSGFFRDAFPGVIAMLDEAVRTVAELDEPPEQNFVRKHVLDELAQLGDGAGDPAAAMRRATTRLFGPRPGAYGAGLLQLLETRAWRDTADLAAVFEAWSGHAYGRGLDGAPAPEAMRAAFARIDVAVKNVDTREHDIFDSDDYFQEHGGMVAMVRHLTGKDPKAAIGDSADPSNVRSRPLQEEARRVFRSRVANPRWIASMVRHGYKGAFELSATVDYLFGYDATTGVVEDWMYEQLASRYALDADLTEFLRRSNPWALQAICERLLEAADRGLWQAPSDGVLDALREQWASVDDALEGAEA